MKTYTSKDYRLYTAADNGTAGFMVLESKTENKYLVFDWDLSDKEIVDTADKFYSGILCDNDFQTEEWTEGDFRKEGFTWFQEADEYVKGLPAEYTVIWVAGKRDGETLKEFDDRSDAIQFANEYYKDHEEEFDPVYGGVSIIDKDGNSIEW